MVSGTAVIFCCCCMLFAVVVVGVYYRYVTMLFIDVGGVLAMSAVMMHRRFDVVESVALVNGQQ